MPATENVWRNLNKMHVVFAASSVALLFATVWMMFRDFDDEWRVHQRQARKFAADRLKAAKAAEEQGLGNKPKELEDQVNAQLDKLKSHQQDLDKLNADKAALDATLAKLSREVKFKKAELGTLKADMGLLVRDLASQDKLKAKQAAFDQMQVTVEAMELQLQLQQAQSDKVNKDLAAITRSRDEAQSAFKKLTTDRDRTAKALAQIEPDNWLSRGKLWLMEQPIVDGFNGPFKINQIWLPDLKINYGGMSDVARFDRCITCHVNIDKFEAGNLATYPYNPHGLPQDSHHAVPSGDHVTTAGYRHPYASHPRPDLYLTDASPHRMGKFGCTSCHDGQGSGTSFQNASHSPSSLGQEHHWADKHGYFHNHFWEAPMSPGRLTESGCVKCHHNVVELGTSKKFGNTAPKLMKGYELVRQYGCFGCHEINGFNVGRQIGPDMRLEPQTPEESARIAADPNAVAGTMRKVGPGLRHLASKTNKAWTRDWVSDPTKFRPDTRMPKFFHLTGQLFKEGKDSQADHFEPVEIQAITEFLFARSEKLELKHWAANYQPDMVRGKDLFSKRGCLACHEHGEFPGIKQDFGPNLTNVFAKITRDEASPYSSWMYTWLLNPSSHSPRTKMPDLYLQTYTEVGPDGKSATVDPAADIMAFLLSQPEKEGKRKATPAPADPRGEISKKAIDDLVLFYLKKSGLNQDDAANVLKTGKYPKPARDVKGDEIELADKPITEAVKLQYLGRRSVSRYGCYGCHDIPDFDKARPIGTALQDWGRKDPSKLALEHIEEYLEFYGEKDSVTGKRSSTAKRAEAAKKSEIAGEKPHSRAGKDDTSAAFFYEQILSHGRSGFLWQKLREPRSYDYATLSTKAYDERLRMPQFPFDEQEIEAIATYILGLVADPPAEKYVYRPTGAAKARIEGEKTLAKFNCAGCHMLDLPEITFEGKLDSLSATSEVSSSDYPEGVALLKRLKPPRDLSNQRLSANGEAIIKFHGLISSPPDATKSLEEQESSYVLWEPLKVGEEDAGKDEDGRKLTKDKLVYPAAAISIPGPKMLNVKPARGGVFAEWLVDRLMTQKPVRDRKMAQQSSPPPLYREGIKVQTPWLYQFLKDPQQLRYTTVLRMPRFNMSDEEASVLANYFAAYDEVEFPYVNIPQRDSEYLAAHEKMHPDYLKGTWKLLNAPLCSKCHAVGGQEYRSTDPNNIRGPDLDRVRDRLRPDWTMLWLYNPLWITPGTSMPQTFPRDQVNFPEHFKGVGNTQTIAARDALMNYARLLETEGRTAAASASATAGSGGVPRKQDPPAGKREEQPAEKAAPDGKKEKEGKS